MFKRYSTEFANNLEIPDVFPETHIEHLIHYLFCSMMKFISDHPITKAYTLDKFQWLQLYQIHITVIEIMISLFNTSFLKVRRYIFIFHTLFKLFQLFLIYRWDWVTQCPLEYFCQLWSILNVSFYFLFNMMSISVRIQLFKFTN